MLPSNNYQVETNMFIREMIRAIQLVMITSRHDQLIQMKQKLEFDRNSMVRVNFLKYDCVYFTNIGKVGE